MKYVYGILVALVLILAALTLDPSLISIGGTSLALVYPISQIIAMRGIIAIVLGVLGIMIAMVAIIRALMLRRGIFLGVLSAGLILIAGGHLLVLADRGLSAPTALPPDYGVTHVSQGNGDITVLSYNTLGGQTSMDDLAPVAADNGVDVIVLTETSTQSAEALAGRLSQNGPTFSVYSSGADPNNPEIESTAILVSSALGEYRQGPDLGLSWGSVHLRSTGDGPDIIGVHPVAPVREFQDKWKAEITAIYEQCSGAQNTIMAGDFNSTIDHMHATGAECSSALDGFVGGYGTWPASVPGILGSPIDNVYTDWTTKSATVVQVGGSDHRGVLVRLAR